MQQPGKPLTKPGSKASNPHPHPAHARGTPSGFSYTSQDPVEPSIAADSGVGLK